MGLREPSELEGVCLGLISKLQPCTAYQVRGALKASPSSHWQASAGSVYPLFARLEQADFIAIAVDENDGRGRKLMSMTARGRQALKRWIRAGSGPELVSSMMDPVRSRMFFLDELTANQRRQYIDDLIRQMELHMVEVRERLKQSPQDEDIFGHLGALGAQQVTEARLEWLRLVKKRIIG
jgi:DNA-binding PadR family transcriptional regulator